MVKMADGRVAICFAVLSGLFVISVAYGEVTASVKWDADSGNFVLYDKIVENYVAKGKFRNEVNTTG